MPTYEYHCEKGHVFEEFQSIVAEPLHICPICGAHAERQISGGTGLIFKGSGFYITDYAHKNNSGSSPAHHQKRSEEKSETPTPKTEVKTETKPEAKTDAKADAKPADKSTKPGEKS
jgi:putative FmdB family regulatory protein